MNWVQTLATLGGLFAVLAFIHFAIDWIFQTHAEAMVKHNNPKIRAKHCLIYTLGFLPFLYVCNFNFWEWVASINILFWSHFYLDTYHVVFLWAKHIRRPPEMTEAVKFKELDGYVTVKLPDPNNGFIEWVKTPMGKILMIAIDQITHLLFLFIIAALAMRHI